MARGSGLRAAVAAQPDAAVRCPQSLARARRGAGGAADAGADGAVRRRAASGWLRDLGVSVERAAAAAVSARERRDTDRGPGGDGASARAAAGGLSRLSGPRARADVGAYPHVHARGAAVSGGP